MICNSCGKVIPNDTKFCCYCGNAVPKQQISDPVDKQNNNTHIMQPHEDEPNWGMFINEGSYRYGRSKNCPDWVKPIQRDKWETRGLIIWDKNAIQVTKLWAGQALKLLDEMIKTGEWKETGITVGEPAMQIRIDMPRKPKRKGKKEQEAHEEQPQITKESKWVLTNKIDLSVTQSVVLFDFLNENQNLLQKLAHEEQEETSKRLSEVYRIILGDKLWNGLAALYQVDPDRAMKLGMDAVRTALGEKENIEPNG